MARFRCSTARWPYDVCCDCACNRADLRDFVAQSGRLVPTLAAAGAESDGEETGEETGAEETDGYSFALNRDGTMTSGHPKAGGSPVVGTNRMTLRTLVPHSEGDGAEVGRCIFF